MVKQRKDARRSQVSDQVPAAEKIVEPPELAGVSQSDFGRNSNFSFASAAFANNLKNRVKTIKDKQNEYVQ